MKLFTKKKTGVDRVTTRVTYPAGVAIDTEGGVYFILKSGARVKCFSQRVVDSWRFDLVPGSLASVAGHPYQGNLGFRDGTLINNIADGKIYLISGQLRRHVTSPDVFVKLGLDRAAVIEVSDEETNLHKEGAPLN